MRRLALLAAAALVAAAAGEAPDDDRPSAGVSDDQAAQARGGIVAEVPATATRARPRHAYGTVLEVAPLAQAVGDEAAARAERTAAAAKVEASRAAFERAQRLFRADQNVSKAELQAAEATFRADEAASAAATARVRTLAATTLAEWGPALAAGGPEIDALLAGRTRLIRVTVPDGPAPEAAYLAGSAGAFRFLSPAGRADPRLPGASSLFTAPAEPRLVPGANLDVLVEGEGKVAGAVVPESAVVRWQGGDWIYLETGTAGFARRRIDTDVPVPGGYLVAGLPAGQKIVVRGAQLLLSQEFQGKSEDSD